MHTPNLMAPKGHSPPDRSVLFDDIFAKIMRRDAFVPIKNERLNLDVEKALLSHHASFMDADTDEKLLYAIQRMNNARKDVHVKLWLVEGGLQMPGIETPPGGIRFDRLPVLQAPICFSVDYGQPGSYCFFLADHAEDLAAFTPQTLDIGDRLLAVNGVAIDAYFQCLEPYLRWSTLEGLWWTMARMLACKSREVAPQLYRDDVTYRLERRNGEIYEVTLPYCDAAHPIDWQGHFRQQGQARYPGFSRAFQRPCFDAYLADEADILLLDWARFNEEHVVDDTDALVAWARDRDILGHAVIFDGTRSRGGGYGAYVLQALSPKPFKGTGGNLRLSDIIEPFIDLIRRGREEGACLREIDAGVWMDDGSWLWDWLVHDVRRDLRQGREYSATVPFKLTHLPKSSNGVLPPRPDHFSGPMVALFGPHGGSHLDQFAAMLVDNKLARTVGMPTAGYSNTWEWVEDVPFPTTGRPAIAMMWSMGHTVRPNGDLLEGNPPAVDEYMPQTRDNFLQYPETLLERALRHIV